jgi:putative nucleotidyltransferase with HDIG domain
MPEPRKSHSLAVGKKAERIAERLPPAQRPEFIAAAYLHDIGYANSSIDFHPIDGARFLRDRGFSALVLHLVANHTAARVEADVRGIDPALFDEFAYSGPPVDEATDLLWWADLTTGPTGETVSAAQRLAEIKERYGPDHVVTTAIVKAEPLLLAAVQRVEGSM